MDNTFVSESYKKFRKGDSISDDELSALIKNHKQLLKNIDELNDRRFDLFRNQLRWDLNSFEGFQEARKNRK